MTQGAGRLECQQEGAEGDLGEKGAGACTLFITPQLGRGPSGPWSPARIVGRGWQVEASFVLLLSPPVCPGEGSPRGPWWEEGGESDE